MKLRRGDYLRNGLEVLFVVYYVADLVCVADVPEVDVQVVGGYEVFVVLAHR